MEPFVLRATRSVPRLGILAGDRIVFDSDADSILALWRPIPNIGATLLAWEEGALEAITRPPSPSELRQVVGLEPVRPASRCAESSRRHRRARARLALLR